MGGNIYNIYVYNYYLETFSFGHSKNKMTTDHYYVIILKVF